MPKKLGLRENPHTMMMTTVLDVPKPHVLRTGEEYEAAIAEIQRLLDEGSEAGTDSFDRLELLSVLVEYYEEEHYPMGAVAPQEAVSLMPLEAPEDTTMNVPVDLVPAVRELIGRHRRKA